MEPKTVTIRYETFRCDLYLTPDLGTLPVTNWRKLLRLAMKGRDPWAEWYEENGKALREIRHYLPDLIAEADMKASRAENAFDREKKRIPQGCDRITRERIKDHNYALERAAKDARAKYHRLLKMMTAFIEETQNYVL